MLSACLRMCFADGTAVSSSNESCLANCASLLAIHLALIVNVGVIVAFAAGAVPADAQPGNVLHGLRCRGHLHHHPRRRSTGMLRAEQRRGGQHRMSPRALTCHTPLDISSLGICVPLWIHNGARRYIHHLPCPGAGVHSKACHCGAYTAYLSTMSRHRLPRSLRVLGPAVSA